MRRVEPETGCDNRSVGPRPDLSPSAAVQPKVEPINCLGLLGTKYYGICVLFLLIGCGFIQEMCRFPSLQTLLEFAGQWSIEEEPLPLLEVYIVALLSYVEASPYLSPQCENVQLVVERLSL